MSPNRIALAVIIALVGLVFSPQQGEAQLTVQQPVFGVNSVATTVSVPDRGTAYLGGVSSAASSRKSYGPIPSGINYGSSLQNTGMSAHVYIHDFEAMDRYLLGQAPTAPPASSQLSGNARHAWNQLQAQHGSAAPQSLPNPQTLSKAEKYWRLGQHAEQEGKFSVARLHYRIAGKYGSAAAKTRLAQLKAAGTDSAVAHR